MDRTLRSRTLALAGLFQSCHLAQQVARRGMADSDSLKTVLNSLFAREAESIEAVYGGSILNLRPGLQALIDQLGTPRQSAEQLELTRYAIGLLHLERKLSKRPQLLSAIGDGIERAHQQVDHYGLLHNNVMANLASLYSDHISPLGARILINGEAIHLNNPDSASRIRALLLAGIRAAVLWQQKGGRRWQIVLRRGALLATARELLAEAGSGSDA